MTRKDLLWCPGWDLNPHSPYGKRDFKYFHCNRILLIQLLLCQMSVEVCKLVCKFWCANLFLPCFQFVTGTVFFSASAPDVVSGQCPQ